MIAELQKLIYLTPFIILYAMRKPICLLYDMAAMKMMEALLTLASSSTACFDHFRQRDENDVSFQMEPDNCHRNDPTKLLSLISREFSAQSKRFTGEQNNSIANETFKESRAGIKPIHAENTNAEPQQADPEDSIKPDDSVIKKILDTLFAKKNKRRRKSPPTKMILHPRVAALKRRKGRR